MLRSARFAFLVLTLSSTFSSASFHFAISAPPSLCYPAIMDLQRSCPGCPAHQLLLAVVCVVWPYDPSSGDFGLVLASPRCFVSTLFFLFSKYFPVGYPIPAPPFLCLSYPPLVVFSFLHHCFLSVSFSLFSPYVLPVFVLFCCLYLISIQFLMVFCSPSVFAFYVPFPFVPSSN